MQTDLRKAHIQTEYLTEVRRVIAEWISRNAFHDSLITVTKCVPSEFQGRISIYVSVFPEHKMPGALSFLTRHGAEIADYLQQAFRNRRKPYLIFEPDVSGAGTHNVVEIDHEPEQNG